MSLSISCKKGKGDKDHRDPKCYDTPPTNELCQAYFQSWFYDQKTGSCYKKGYSGCSVYGFATKEECEECDCTREKPKTEPKSDYIVFGDFHGMCGGEQCIEIFKLGKNSLFEDRKDEYPNRDKIYEGKFEVLPQTKFKETKDLMGAFPTDLLNETKTIFGIPDAYDQGGYYLEYNMGGTHKYWILDKNKSKIPLKYHAFVDKMSEKIESLH